MTAKDMKAFAAKVVALKEEAMLLGLYRTGHALEPATQAVGYEIADIIERQQEKP